MTGLIEVEIPLDQWNQATAWGRVHFNHWTHKHGSQKLNPEKIKHYCEISAVGERAVSCYYGLGHKFVNHGPVRVGDAVIRTTDRANGKLIIHPDDDKKAIHILVIVIEESKTAYLAGWAFPDDAMKKGKFGDPLGTGRYCYVLEQEKLRPMADLMKVNGSLFVKQRGLSGFT